MRAVVVVFHFPQPEAHLPLFGRVESEQMEELLIISAMASLDYAILPRAVWLAFAVQKAILNQMSLKRRQALRVRSEPHRKFGRIVGPD